MFASNMSSSIWEHGIHLETGLIEQTKTFLGCEDCWPVSARLFFAGYMEMSGVRGLSANNDIVRLSEEDASAIVESFFTSDSNIE